MSLPFSNSIDDPKDFSYLSECDVSRDHGSRRGKLRELAVFSGLKQISAKHERRKVVLWKNRGVTFLYNLFHLVPLGASLALVILNTHGYFIGDVATNTTTGLQFAAKFLEVLIQTSLSIILLAWVRHTLMQGGSLPFGAVLAPAFITNLSYCLSLDLWGYLSKWKRRPTRAASLLIFAPFAILLAAICGPSAAILLIPRPVETTSGEVTVLLNDIADYSPSSVSVGDVSQFNATLLNQTMQQLSYLQPVPGDGPCESIVLYNSRSIREVQCNSTAAPNSALTEAFFSIPGRGAADALTGVFTNEGWYGLRTRFVQPVVSYQCYTDTTQLPATLNSTWLENTPIPLGPLAATNISMFNLSVVPNISTTSCENCQFYSDLVQAPQGSNYSLLLVQAVQIFDEIVTTACSYDAFWVNASVRLSLITQIVSAEVSTEMTKQSTRESTFMSIEWAQALYDLYRSRFLQPPTPNLPDSMALLLTFGLSNVGIDGNCIPLVSINEPYTQWATLDNNLLYGSLTPEQIQSLNNSIDRNDVSTDDYLLTSSNWNDANSLYQLQLQLIQSGYGFSTAGTTVKLSLVVLILYVVIAAIYLFWSLKIGFASFSWDSVGDILMLGLNSKTPDFLGHTSAGIETLHTYRQDVRIMASTVSEKVELVFENDREIDWRRYEQVKVNKAY